LITNSFHRTADIADSISPANPCPADFSIRIPPRPRVGRTVVTRDKAVLKPTTPDA
jgi:hypothetical protein